MKIVDVHTMIVDGGWRNWVFVMVETDEAFTGYGECTLEGREQAVAGAVQDFRRHLIGEPADSIRRLVRQLSRHGYWESGPVISSALGGVEMALWDIYAKSLGVPVSSVFGGRVRDELDAYSNAWYFGAITPKEFAECASRTVSLGYRGLKFDPFETAEFTIDDKTLARSIERVAAVRDAVGNGVSLMVEGHGRFGVEAALRVSKWLEPLGVRFFEEPTPAGDERALAQVAKASAVPVAAGERAYSLRDCERLIRAGVAVLQPDVVHLGGLSAMLAAAELCDSMSVAFAPHNASGPVATAATLQVSSVAPSLLMQEMFCPFDTEWKDKVALPPVAVKDGRVRAPSGPGLGVTIDLEEITCHPYVPRDLDLFGRNSVLSRRVGATTRIKYKEAN
jgi:galactonate dehydratase